MQLKNKLHVLMDLPHKLFRQFGISCRKINCWPTVPGEVKAFFYMFRRRRALGWLQLPLDNDHTHKYLT